MFIGYNYSLVQVSSDLDIIDNIYTGELLFKRIGSNKWLIRFMIAQNVKILLQVVLIIILIYSICDNYIIILVY